MIGGLGDAAQIGALGQKGDGAKGAELFGDPEADVGGTCDQGCIRIFGIPFGQLIRGGWLDRNRGRCPRSLRLLLRSFFSEKKCEVFQMPRDRLVLRSLSRADDGGVAGAAAQVARKLHVMVRRPVEMGGGHAHDKAGRAEATLAAVKVDHRLLDRMQRAVGCRQPLNRCDRFAVHLGQEEDAAVEGTGAAGVGDHHRTRTTITFIAAFFGAGETAGVAEPVE